MPRDASNRAVTAPIPLLAPVMRATLPPWRTFVMLPPAVRYPLHSLTKRAVVDRALELADAHGLDALTIRKLATELGVTPMALYWHFRSKEELLGGLVDRVWGEINVDVDPAARWPDQL